MIKPVTALFLMALVVFSLSQTACGRSMSPDQLKASMQITDLETKWASKFYQPWPPRLILVPVLQFRIKNVSDRPLTYVNFNVVFRFKADNENFGDCFLAAIRGTPVAPGEKSDVITLKSNFGVEARNVNSFKDNPRWRIAVAKVFSTSRGSQPVLLGEYQISQKIDFKEPEAVHMGEKPGAIKEKEKK
jgi:hypothetical protein